MEFISEKRGNSLFLEYATSEDELDDFACRMFAANEIPFMIPFSILHRDDEVLLEYNVSGLKEMDGLITSVVTRNRMVRILSGFINAYSEIEDFMLDADHVILDKEHVYYNRLTESLSLIYLPINAHAAESDNSLQYLSQLLQQLRFDARDEDLEVSVQRIIREIDDGEIYDLATLKSVQKKLNLYEDIRHERVEQGQSETDDSVEVKSVRLPKDATTPVSRAVSEAAPERAESEGGAKAEPQASAVSRRVMGFSIPGREDKTPSAVEPPAADSEPESKPVKKKPIFAVPGLTKKGSAKEPPAPVPEKPPQEKPEKSVINVPLPDNEDRTMYFKAPASLERLSDRMNIMVRGEAFTIGRSSGCNFKIDDPKISREHARIDLVDGEYFITDLHSSNHTWLNGQVLQPYMRLALNDGDQIRLNRETYIFRK